MENLEHKYDASVIVPTYNRSKLLDYTLNSLFLQTIPKDRYEVIIADDGSYDDTLEVVKKYESKMNVKYVFQEDEGYRPASARNMGIRAAEGAVCIFIDSGVIANSNCVQEHINFYEENGFNKAVIGYVYGFDQGDGLLGMLRKMINPDNAHESISKLSKTKMFIDVRDYHYITYKDQIQDLPATWLYFWTCHLSVPRECLLSVGLFDENYDGRWGCEDNDLGLRLMQDGVKIHLVRAAEALHIPHYEDFEEKKIQGYSNCVYFNNKFQVPETQLFLDNYMNDIFTDINAIRMHTKWFENA